MSNEREIKFRGQRVDNGEWVYGHLVIDGEQSFIIQGARFCPDSAGTPIAFNEWYEIKPETVGQFTGLIDNNGKEIYEGDIMDYGGFGKKQIIFSYGSFGVLNSDGSFGSYNISDGIIIGNIYEHKHLIEKNLPL